MARKVRVEYPGAIYHVMNRGDRREDIFHDDEDRQRFLDTLAEACEKTGWQVHTYCLMRNHFHLVVETPRPNLVAGMKWFLGTYTSRFNRRYRQFGHLFSGRYKALMVDGDSDGYLRTVCEYVHLNPVRAKLLRPDQKLRTYQWSSYVEYLKKPKQRVQWLRVDRLLGEMGIARDGAAGRREFERQLELRRRQSKPQQWMKLRRGWCLGSEAFRERLLTHIAQHARDSHRGEEVRESDEQKARRIIAGELHRLGWRPADLQRYRKGDSRKVKIAHRLRTQTTMTLNWIAEELKMGAGTYVSNRLYHLRGNCVNTRD